MTNRIAAAVNVSLIGALLSGCVAGRLTESEYARLKAASDGTVRAMRAQGALTQARFDTVAGYAVFPTIGKAGLWGLTFGFGPGLVYKDGEVIGHAAFNAANIGFAAGAQAYRQVVFLQSESDVEKFTKGRWAGAVQANAVIGTADASADADFYDGQNLQTFDHGGLMLEATIGLQKYSYRPIEQAVQAPSGSPEPESSGEPG
ncbi:MAG: hypothetical protein ACF8R7_06450 [Phycisphaerales bacterium JB039]